jgi:FAD/FMN-containing dehydrogenase
MSGPVFSPPGPWANYHSTVVQPAGQVRARLSRTASPAPTWTWADALARAQEVHALLASPLMRSAALVTLGAGWSLSGLLDTRQPGGLGVLLETASMAGAMPWPAAEPGGQPLVLAGGGTTIRQLCDWLEPRGLMLRSAGSHDGATLAGAAGTGTHGAWLGEGGAADQIAALLLVTGPGEPVWLTPLAGPAPCPGKVRHIADDALFRSARTHLGALGVVVAALVRPRPLQHFRLLRQMDVLPAGWPVVMASMDLAAWGQQLLQAGSPLAYFEMDFDPHDPMRTLLTGLAPIEDRLLPPPLDPLSVSGVLDALALGAVQKGQLPPAYDSYVGLLNAAGQIGNATAPPTSLGGFVQRHERIVPQLYSSALAFERQRLPEVLQQLQAAAAGLPPHMVCALRPVRGLGGALDFCGWDDTLVLNIDGYGALMDPGDSAATMMDRICARLVAAGVPHRLHWGKQGPFSRTRIETDYGANLAAWADLRQALDVDSRFNLPWLQGLGVA